jgi:DNA polymerase-3 subunit alpha
MGKKKPEEMAKQREIFQDGARKLGIDEALAAQIFDLMEKFAGYGFNKSHSAAYALVSYQTAWLKAHYPAEFFAATMSADMHNTDKIVGLIDDAEQNRITIVPPDINRSAFKFTVADERSVVYGLGAIKGVGENAVAGIIEEREARGAFRDLFDFCARADLRKVNRRVIEALINSGALDHCGPSRAVMLASLDEAMKAAEQAGRDRQSGQVDLFGGSPETRSAEPSWVRVHSESEEEQLRLEKETLGLYLTAHPIDRYLKELSHFCAGRLSAVQPTRRGENLLAAGLLINIRVMINKSGARWAILTLDDKSGRLEAKIYSELYEKHKHQLIEDSVIVLEGDVQEDEYLQRPSMTVRNLFDIAEARSRYARRLELELDGTRLSRPALEKLVQLLRDFGPGGFPVLAGYRNREASVRVAFGESCRVQPRDELLQRLRQIEGCERVEIVYS